MPDNPDRRLYLTTKEVAELIRVRERKVYDLAAADEIPHRRITGKLLFPAAEIMAWIEGRDAGMAAERPAVATGSHDPLLGWAIRESGSGLATLWNGSMDGLESYAAGRAALAGLHIPEPEGWNTATVAARGLSGSVLIGWARRARGLLLSPALSGTVRKVADLKGRRLVLRQSGAGASALLDRLLAEAGMTHADIRTADTLARTESDAAAMVSGGEAEAALGIEAMARQYHLGFQPLLRESYDLLIDRRAYFTDPVQDLIRFTATAPFRDRAKAMGGYDLGVIGTVRWLSA